MVIEMLSFATETVVGPIQVDGVVVLAKVLLGCHQCGFNGVLCFFWYVRRGFHPTFEYFLVFCDFDVSFSPPSLDLMPPDIRFSAFVKGEKLVKALLLSLQ